MRSRRVPVLKLGSRGPGGDARSLRCVRKASASLRRRSQAFTKRSQSVRKAFAKRSRRARHAGETNETKIVAKCRTVVTFYVSHYKSVNSRGDRGVVVAKPGTVVTFGLVSGVRVSKVSTVAGIRGVVVAKPGTVVTFGLVSDVRLSKVSTVTGIGGVVVAKPRTVVT